VLRYGLKLSEDVRHRYCGNCHKFHERPEIDALLEKFCKDRITDMKKEE